MARIGWIGAGKMGLPVCKRLKAAGHEVKILARSPERESELRGLGFETETSAPELARGAEVVFTCVPDDNALAAVVLGDGFASALAPSSTLIDMSTVSPAVSARIAECLPEGFAYLRSPVSGSTAMAEAGTLTALTSGPKAAFDAMGQVLGAFTKKAFHLGEGEEARFLKLAINSMVAATAQLLGEALAFARKGGLTHAAMLEVMTQSAVASPLIGYKTDMIVSGDYRPAATLDMLVKDLDLLMSAARDMDVALPVNAMIRDIYGEASRRGLGEKDFFVLVQEAGKAASAAGKQ